MQIAIDTEYTPTFNKMVAKVTKPVAECTIFTPVSIRHKDSKIRFYFGATPACFNAEPYTRPPSTISTSFQQPFAIDRPGGPFSGTTIVTQTDNVGSRSSGAGNSWAGAGSSGSSSSGGETEAEKRAVENARAQAVRDARKKKLAAAEAAAVVETKLTPFAGKEVRRASMGGGSTFKGAASEENLEKFQDVPKMKPDEQSQMFLLAFAQELTGQSNEVLQSAEMFKTYMQPGEGSLDEVTAHKLLEDKGKAKTYQEMRDVMREIDQDSDGRISLMEWLLFEFNKT
eukprot:gene14654-18581_t